MTHTIERRNGITVVTFTSRAFGLFRARADAFDDIRNLLPHENGLQPVVVDLSAVQGFGASFLTLLLLMRDQIALHGGRLALSGPTPFGRFVLKVTRLDTVFEVFDSRDNAICELSNTHESHPDQFHGQRAVR